MRQSMAEIYLHFVWATYQRMPLLGDDVERAVYACIAGECKRLRCEVLAIGGMPDHVHLAVRVPATVAPFKLMNQVKGVSSALVRKQLLSGELFGWQDGYAVFSFSRTHRERVVAYIRCQERHHATGELWKEWEQIADPDGQG
ncbi:IS200/IS605-like element ISEc46 family transposase [soil metagenome]